MTLPAVLPLLAASALLQTPPSGGRIVVLDETKRELRVFADDTLAPAGGDVPAKCRLLPLALLGRAAADVLDETLPQESLELGVPAVRLPGGGWLAKFRDHARQETGILWIDRLGQPHVLFTRPLFGGVDMLLDAIAVSGVEERAAIVQDENLTGRGDVWLLRFDGKTFASSGTAARHLTGTVAAPDADPSSLAFADGALFFVDDDDTLRRAPTDGSADAVAIALPPSAGQTPVEISNEIAVSRDGSTLAFQAGQSEKSWDLYVAKADGTVSNLSKAPGEFQTAGFLPGTPLGPMLSLGDDGARVTYGLEAPDLELFTRATDGSDVPVQLTSDAEFEHSLADGSTVITFVSGFFFALGETEVNQDFYAGTIEAGAPAIRNVTRTSRDRVAPFDKGARMAPIVAARSGGDRGLIVVNAGAGASSFDLWSLGSGNAAPRTSGLTGAPRLVIGAVPDSPGRPGVPVTLAVLPTAAGDALALVPDAPGIPMTTLLVTMSGVTIPGIALRDDGREAAFIARVGAGFDLIAAIDLTTGAIRVLTPVPGFSNGRVGYSPQGRILAVWSPTPTLLAVAEDPPGSGRLRPLPNLSGPLSLLTP